MKLVQVAFLQEVRFGGEYLRVVRMADGWSAERCDNWNVELRRDGRRLLLPAANCAFEYEDEPVEAPRPRPKGSKTP